MSYLSIGGLFIVLGVGGFYFLIFPIWMIYHAAKSQQIGAGAKALWIAANVLVGPFGGAFYGLFVSKKRLLQWFSAGFFLFCAVSGVAMIVWGPALARRIHSETTGMLENFNQGNLPEQRNDASSLEKMTAELKKQLGL